MSQVIVKTENISKSYGAKRGIDRVNMSVRPGTVYALLGNNGAGKTTAIKMMAGQMIPDSGTVSVFGMDPVKHGVEIKKRMAYVAEAMKVYDWMTLNDLFRLVKSFSPAWNAERCRRLVESFELPLHIRMKHFSHGMYAKGVFLAAICREPELLVLDDPCLGLDTVSRRSFMEMLADSLEDYGKTVVLSTHLIQEAAGMFDRVGIMNRGRLIVEQDVGDLLDETWLLTVPAEHQKLLPELAIIQRREMGPEILFTVKGRENEIGNRLRGMIPSLRFRLDGLSLEDIFVAYTS